MKTILITGATGFIGKSLINRLLEMDYRIVSLVRRKSEIRTEFIQADFFNREDLKSIVHDLNPSIVLHLASEKIRSNIDFFQAVDSDFEISKNLIEACLKSPRLEKFIFLGSCEEYGTGFPPFSEENKEYPVSNYSYSKLKTVNLLNYLYRNYNFPAIILRPSVVYGPGQGTDMFLPDLINKLILKEKFEMSLGEQTRDYLYINDLIKAIIQVITSENIIGKILNLASSTSYKIREITQLVADILEIDFCQFIRLGALPYRKNEIMDYRVNSKLAECLLGWKSETDIRQGLLQTVEYYKKLYTHG
ncbi:NAD-dependent epimerase/dehydratase family protein [Leptospira kanakyensis]|uniref:NAD-dependent epimerase/dehydratase family protein n=1 Tax=Leptospira kanakyensis TaxID=2484968 RepID=UPI00223D0ABB|nr:NAD(P)-dependent oxidoreductase [Leptospira kanakyensis]MCW7471389.1 NAD(P)-dependent oxidoreductase [Leptospira kanakyensis]